MKFLITLYLALFLVACSKVPEGVKAVEGFEIESYLGKWYEIARLDNRFEKGLQRVTAEYTLQENGSIKVENRGFSLEEQQWQEAIGKAKFAGEADIGELKVSFFGPFYGPYIVYELDKTAYQYAFVASKTGYLWLLARTPNPPQAVVTRFIESAKALGYKQEELVFVEHK